MYEITIKEQIAQQRLLVVINAESGNSIIPSFYVERSPTANCQLSSLSCFSSVLSFLHDNQKDVEFIKAVREAIFKSVYKSQILIDVYDSFENILPKLFYKSEIVFTQKYTNPTGSKMLMALIKFDRNKIEPPKRKYTWK